MWTANYATIMGFGLIVAALVAVFFSPYRRWLSFMLAGMVFWGLLEMVRFGIQSVFIIPLTYSYLCALSPAMLAITMLLLREDHRAQKPWLNASTLSILQFMKTTSNSVQVAKNKLT